MKPEPEYTTDYSVLSMLESLIRRASSLVDDFNGQWEKALFAAIDEERQERRNFDEARRNNGTKDITPVVKEPDKKKHSLI